MVISTQLQPLRYAGAGRPGLAWLTTQLAVLMGVLYMALLSTVLVLGGQPLLQLQPAGCRSEIANLCCAGAGRPRMAWLTTQLAVLMGVLSMAASSAVLMLGRRQLALLFTADTEVLALTSQAVPALAASLIGTGPGLWCRCSAPCRRTPWQASMAWVPNNQKPEQAWPKVKIQRKRGATHKACVAGDRHA